MNIARNISLFVLSALLAACSPQLRLARLIERHPELHRDSIVVLHDTVVRDAVSDSIYITRAEIAGMQAAAGTAQTNAHNEQEAASVVAGKAAAVLRADTAGGFWLYARQAADTIVLCDTLQIPVYYTKTVARPPTKWEAFRMQMGSVFIGVLAVFLLLATLRIVRKFL